MIRRFRSFALLLSVLQMIAPDLASAQSVPVYVGGNAEFDACGSNGEVTGLDPNGDNFLSLRSAPSGKAPELARLNGGDEVFICDRKGAWLGIVYGLGSCGVTSPIVKRKAYRGGCRSGWVFGRYIRLTAG